MLFEKATLKIFKNHAATIADSLFKINLCDNLITDEFIDTTDKLLTLAIDFPKKNPNMPRKDITESLVSQMKLIQKTTKLSSASNVRGQHGILAGIIKNRTVMRDEVLASLKGGAGSEFTKEIVRGLNFFCPDLFGQVPESLIKTCIKNSAFLLKGHSR